MGITTVHLWRERRVGSGKDEGFEFFEAGSSGQLCSGPTTTLAASGTTTLLRRGSESYIKIARSRRVGIRGWWVPGFGGPRTCGRLGNAVGLEVRKSGWIEKF